MTYRPRWRKAIGISIIFHILFWGVIGWLAGKAVTPIEAEPYIELELLTDASIDDSELDEPLPNSQSAPSAAPVQTVQVRASKAASPATSEVVTVANELAMEAVASSQSASSNESTGNFSSGSDGVGNSGSGGSGTNVGSNSGGNGGRKGKIVRPQILSKVDPDYPEGARTAGLTGTVVVKIQILANGLPGDVTISATSGHDILDAAVVAAVQKWRFVPAKDPESGASIMCYTNMPVTFRFK
ncbi:energy transducer TonB [Pelosinus fermentans]|uniref:TonB family protein n=1 Tax=Pelosinus fermentans JBW45 TaxID=1192197 RepID=I8TQB2_9FIRM|nr:energy transducer TonB [Pelosinus fermentans]AJQ28728.1 TonB family protein [Pelosinus fermentans JBW45]